VPEKVVTRFAPSPTGYLHIGGGRTALFNWLWARCQGGTFILRIEDTDLKRNTPTAMKQVMQDLRWLGIEWEKADVGGRMAKIAVGKARHYKPGAGSCSGGQSVLLLRLKATLCGRRRAEERVRYPRPQRLLRAGCGSPGRGQAGNGPVRPADG
jgi:hypothetical protein